MADFHKIHSKIWTDAWFYELGQLDKLFFIYLFSNTRANIAGIYEIPMPVIAAESGLSPDQARAAFERFESAGKAYYEDGVVWVKNLRQYHETSSPTLQKRLQKDVDAIKDCPLKRRYLAYYGEWEEGEEGPDPEPEPEHKEGGEDSVSELPFDGIEQGDDTVSIGYAHRPSLVLSKYKSKSKTRAREKSNSPPPADEYAWGVVLELCDGDENKAAKIFALEKRVADGATWLRPAITTPGERRIAKRDWWQPLRLALAQSEWDVDTAFGSFMAALGRARGYCSPSRPSGVIGELSKAAAAPPEPKATGVTADWAVVEHAFEEGGQLLRQYPEILATINRMGGWRRFTEASEREWAWLKKEFHQQHKQVSR